MSSIPAAEEKSFRRKPEHTETLCAGNPDAGKSPTQRWQSKNTCFIIPGKASGSQIGMNLDDLNMEEEETHFIPQFRTVQAPQTLDGAEEEASV